MINARLSFGGEVGVGVGVKVGLGVGVLLISHTILTSTPSKSNS